MHLHEIQILNIRSIREFKLSLRREECAGWHVVLGDNGAGKSTFARAVALAFIGPDESAALRMDWREWLRNDSEQGSVRIDVSRHRDFDEVGKGGRQLAMDKLVPAGINLVRTASEEGVERVELSAKSFGARSDHTLDITRYAWGDKPGWFSASYGPFRRFSGGDKSYEKLFHIYQRLGRHLSVFGEDVALTEAIEWLRQLDVERLRHPQQRALLEDVKDFVNQSGFLPHQTQLDEVTESDVLFRDGSGFKVPVTQLSDGFRSVLSMTFELLRQLVRCYGPDRVFERVRNGEGIVSLPGVVVIDEVDAHLHPPWQRRIGQWLIKAFPQLQFLVTTHSPLVCQAAEHGSVWRLPTPGTDEVSRRVTGVEFQRLVRGDLLEAMGTELFGHDVGRSESGLRDLEELARLNRLALQGKLSTALARRRTQLQSQIPTRANVAKPGDGL